MSFNNIAVLLYHSTTVIFPSLFFVLYIIFLFAVKPLYYGAFGSYAPSYDSTFANLTKEESDLVYQTYGDETCVQYAER
jgi:hypothetical protein